MGSDALLGGGGVSILLTPDHYPRILTASVHGTAYRAQQTARLLVMRSLPQNFPPSYFQAWYAHLAPDPVLLRAYRQKTIDWQAFAYAYLCDLEHLPRPAIRADLARWLLTYDSVTLLCCEHAPFGDESLVQCHRRLLRAWLVDDDITF